MRMTFGIILASILVLALYAAAAPDCKTWLPLLPETIDGMPRNGPPRVVNEDNSCAVSQRYLSNDYARAAVITIAQGEHSKYMGFYELMAALAGKAETVTWETISGHKILVQLAEDKWGILYFSPRKDVFLSLQAQPITSKEEMLRLGKFLPLAKLAETR